jgi:hypothetical protein
MEKMTGGPEQPPLDQMQGRTHAPEGDHACSLCSDTELVADVGLAERADGVHRKPAIHALGRRERGSCEGLRAIPS